MKDGKHGGYREGSGRKALPARVRTKGVSVSLRPKHVADAKAMAGGRLASGVQRAIEYTQRQIEASGLGVEAFFKGQ